MSRVELMNNGKAVSADVEDRTLLVHLLRENLNLTGLRWANDYGIGIPSPVLSTSQSAS